MFKDIDRLKDDLLEIFNAGEWYRGVPEFQTFPTLFEINKIHWQNLKKDFIDEVFKFTGRTPELVKAWCYANFPGHAQKEWPLWHTHDVTFPKEEKICGVMYLTYSPEGTVFLKDDKHIYLSGDIGVWNLFDSNEVHSPPKWDPNNKTNRYCIAAEAIYV
jgi:hypothetical protein